VARLSPILLPSRGASPWLSRRRPRHARQAAQIPSCGDPFHTREQPGDSGVAGRRIATRIVHRAGGVARRTLRQRTLAGRGEAATPTTVGTETRAQNHQRGSPGGSPHRRGTHARPRPRDRVGEAPELRNDFGRFRSASASALVGPAIRLTSSATKPPFGGGTPRSSRASYPGLATEKGSLGPRGVPNPGVVEGSPPAHPRARPIVISQRRSVPSNNSHFGQLSLRGFNRPIDAYEVKNRSGDFCKCIGPKLIRRRRIFFNLSAKRGYVHDRATHSKSKRGVSNSGRTL
jgi:hypothetical protein